MHAISTVQQIQVIFLFFLVVIVTVAVICAPILNFLEETLSGKGLIGLMHKEIALAIQQHQLISIEDSEDENLRFDPVIHCTNCEDPKKKNHMVHKDVITAPYNIFYKNLTPKYILGEERNDTASIVMGIPSVHRQKADYLFKTLASVLGNFHPVYEDNISVIVFLAERDLSIAKAIAEKIQTVYFRELNNGLLRVISAPSNFYPSFESLPQTQNDRPSRLQWRSKEVFDAAYLMYYCQNLGNYYLMLEDDIIATKGYITVIKNFMKLHSGRPYAYLSFSRFGSIGKLFRNSDLSIWSTYFFNFFGLKPIDWLIDDFLHIRSCTPKISKSKCEKAKKVMKPSTRVTLFQHIGEYSSLSGKTMHKKDSRFSPVVPIVNVHQNPSAKVSTTLRSTDGSSVVSWYQDSGSMQQHFFVSSVKTGDNIMIDFSQPEAISRILIKTGKKGGFLKLNKTYAIIEVLPETNSTVATTYRTCGTFDENGVGECRVALTVNSIRLRMLVTKSFKVWFDLIFVK